MLDERHMPLRLRPGEPLSEYLRRVHAAERDRDYGDPFTLPPKLYRASEVANHFDLTRQTVHNYATIGLIREHGRTPGGQRLFDESVFRRLHRIQRLKRRYRLHEIRRLLDAEDTAPPAARANYAKRDEHRPAPAAETHASRPDQAGATPISDTARDRREPGPTTATEDAPHHDA
jgi:DNA-binding transcriptional MerR regulator